MEPLNHKYVPLPFNSRVILRWDEMSNIWYCSNLSDSMFFINRNNSNLYTHTHSLWKNVCLCLSPYVRIFFFFKIGRFYCQLKLKVTTKDKTKNMSILFIIRRVSILYLRTIGKKINHHIRFSEQRFWISLLWYGFTIAQWKDPETWNLVWC